MVGVVFVVVVVVVETRLDFLCLAHRKEKCFRCCWVKTKNKKLLIV